MYQGTSISESKATKLLKNESAEAIKLTNKIVCKVYPAGSRMDSSNLNPIIFWNHGFQIVALNFQSEDLAMSLNEAMFNDNGRCGYVLKPIILRDLSFDFDPNKTKTKKGINDLVENGAFLGFNSDINHKPLKTNNHNIKIETSKYLTFYLKIISAQQLPSPDETEIITDIIDPYVSINIYGIPIDCCERKTKTIQDNGFNPEWNEVNSLKSKFYFLFYFSKNKEFKFKIYCPELAFVKFTVKDEDFGCDDFIGEYTLRFENMRQGIKFILNKLKKIIF